MPSEEAKENERRSDFFREVQAGRRDKVEAILNGRPPEDFRGTVYSWVTLENIERRTAFLLAAEAGHLDVMRLLQQRGANIHAVDTGGDTALHAAAEAGHMEVMTTLISEGVNINAQSKRGMTPLYHATATKGQRQAMIALIQLRARVDLADNTDTTPLMVAAKNNNYDAASILLACGASIHKADKSGHNAMDHSQQRMLQLLWFHAARQGDLAGLRRMLAMQVGATGEEGFSDLSRALFNPKGQDQVKLNMHRQLCDARDADGATALSLAVQAEKADTVAYLLSQTASTSMSDDARETPLHHAARAGNAKIAQMLIDERAPLEALNLGDATPLHVAAFLNHVDVVKTLLEAEANIHAYDKQHQTPLHLAVTRQHADTVNALVNAGASLSVRDKDAKTVGDRATEAKMNKEKPRPRPPKDAADYDIPYQPPKPAESYKVVFTKAVAVRDGPSLSAKVVAARVPGEFVMVAEVRDGWARIEKDHRGPLKVDELWMLIDGTPHGFGKLIEPAPLPSKEGAKPAKTGSGDAADDDDDDDAFEG